MFLLLANLLYATMGVDWTPVMNVKTGKFSNLVVLHFLDIVKSFPCQKFSIVIIILSYEHANFLSLAFESKITLKNKRNWCCHFQKSPLKVVHIYSTCSVFSIISSCSSACSTRGTIISTRSVTGGVHRVEQIR